MATDRQSVVAPPDSSRDYPALGRLWQVPVFFLGLLAILGVWASQQFWNDPDVRLVDALARLHLAAGRSGRSLVLVGVGAELRDLAGWMGLGSVLRLESGREAEQREDALGVEEERDRGEPLA